MIAMSLGRVACQEWRFRKPVYSCMSMGHLRVSHWGQARVLSSPSVSLEAPKSILFAQYCLNSYFVCQIPGSTIRRTVGGSFTWPTRSKPTTGSRSESQRQTPLSPRLKLHECFSTWPQWTSSGSGWCRSGPVRRCSISWRSALKTG
jgi:hypothetical protein